MRIHVGLVGSFLLLAACGLDSSTTDPGDGGVNPNPDGNGGGGSCSNGTLFAGDPLYQGTPLDRPTSGTGIKSGPPLQWQTLVFAGTHLYTRQESEIWDVDLSAANPVETKVTGSTPAGSTYDFKMGACSQASLTQLRGLAALPDGSLVAADYWANAIVKISNPSNPASCTVSSLAGTAGPLTGLDPSSEVTLPKGGNADGVGAAASFNEPSAMIADGSGNVYVADKLAASGATVVRKIDSGGKVSTLLKLGTASGAPTDIRNFTVLGGNLYAAADDGANRSYVIQIDTTSGKVTTVLAGNADTFPPVVSGRNPGVSGITNDGKNLIVAGAGYVWYLTLDGKLTLVAGTGLNIDNFPSGYDPKASHPALSLALPATIGPSDENGTGAINHISYANGAVYYRGHASGTAAFVEKIACP